MTQNYAKLKNLLQELFQLNQPDLDFGLYRVMHAKADEVTQFLEKDLLPQVQAAFGQYKTADKAEIEKELAKAIDQANALGADPETLPKVKELRGRLANDAVNVGQLENEVYDHLFSFFRRYYSEGDFLAKRVYKPGVYAIPYEGEEVTLHWANKDQYYIKTSEYLRDYAFRLRPEDDKNPMRVHFRLADAAEGEHGNVKAAEGKDRAFILATRSTAGEVLSEEAGPDGPELTIRFEYRPATLTDWPDESRAGKAKPPAQKDLIAIAAKRILAIAEPKLASWITALGKPHVATSGEQADYSRIEAHLRRYTARNTFDYFIHKDLGSFLRRELDFYIKNEVMHLDDVESETAPRVEQYLSKIKVVRKIAGKVIDFLEQLEDFQKKLWLKKKFVVETQYLITIRSIPEEFYTEIAANDAQREEWVRLFVIDELKAKSGSLLEPGAPGYSVPLTPSFLKAYPTLVVDTKHFDSAFAERVLDAIGETDNTTDGVCVYGDNFQGLVAIASRYRTNFKTAYIDPPYNTEGDRQSGKFLYKDGFAESTWIAMISQLLNLAKSQLNSSGMLFMSLDDTEQADAVRILRSAFGTCGTKPNFIGTMPCVMNLKGNNDEYAFSGTHEYLLCAALDRATAIPGTLPLDEDALEDWIEDERGPYKQGANLKSTGQNAPRTKRPNLWFPVFIDDHDAAYVSDDDAPRKPTHATVWPVTGAEEMSWRWSKQKFRSHEHDVIVSREGRQVSLYKKQRPSLGDMPSAKPKSTLYHPKYSSGSGTEQQKSLFARKVFPNPKPLDFIQDVLRIGLGPGAGDVLDLFGGSGTTGHAIINLNREDGARRRFVLLEMADYFDTVLLTRIKKVTFTPDWKDGKPKRLATTDEAKRSPRIVKVIRLESYEDALNNLETRRSNAQQMLLTSPDAHGADGLKEQYTLRYMLNVETRGSQSLLNVQAFRDPTAYKLKVKRPGSDESREVNVDLLETFNWLVGLTVNHIAAPQTFAVECERDSEKRLRVKGRLKQDAAGPQWFRTVTGTTPDGRKALVIWRKLTTDPEQDNLILDEWFAKQGYSSKDSEFDVIWVNGGNNLENLKTPDDRWKVRLIEEDFHRLMFDTEGV